MVRGEKKKNTGMHGYDFYASGTQDTYLSASLYYIKMNGLFPISLT